MKVFISYCSKVGKELAERLRDRFTEREVDSWTYSEADYTWGDSTWGEIYKEIANREWMIVLNTECTQHSINQRNEYMRALKIGVMTFAFSKHGLEEIPEDLKSRTLGVFSEANYDNSCDRLITDLKRLEERVRPGFEMGQVHLTNEKLMALIRQKPEELNVPKAQECRDTIIGNYLKRTIIRHVARVGFILDEGEVDLQGQYILFDDDVQNFNRRDWDYRVICSQIAEAITSGEHRYLRQILLEHAHAKHALSFSDSSGLDFSLIEKAIDVLGNKGYTPNVILSPIATFVDFVKFFDDKIDWREGDKEQLVLQGRPPLTIYWSNKDVPSKEFVIYDRSAVRWRVKPDKEDGALATAIGVSPLYKDRVNFFAQTLFKVEILKPEAVSVLTLPDQTASEP